MENEDKNQSSEMQEKQLLQDGRNLPTDIGDEVKEAYLSYAMSVIVGRALPDIRDGLKPVHRRVLYSMDRMGNTPDKPYKKSARIVGDIIGKYHPHGDMAVYDTIVRMAQDFSYRYPLVDGQGNFGSIDGDPAAAQRYTEVRMSKASMELLADIDKETVNFIPNYDNSLKEPEVLPAKIPHLLVNGASGIAVGMATNIPPHNLNEVADGAIMFIEDPNVSIQKLMTKIKGPDFPTGATICGKSGIRNAYETGKGEGVGYTLNVPVPFGTGVHHYVDAFQQKLKPVALRFKPDFVLISAGFDAHKDDPLSGISLTSESYGQFTDVVKEIADQICNGRIVSVLEGGYSLSALSESVVEHLKHLSS